MNEETRKTLGKWYRIAQAMEHHVGINVDISDVMEGIRLDDPTVVEWLRSEPGVTFLELHQRIVGELLRDPVSTKATDELRAAVGALFRFMGRYEIAAKA